jgi:hypothetical protein
MTVLDFICLCIAFGCAIISAVLFLFLIWVAIGSMLNDRD